jgi:hypothetical protein
VVCIRGGLDEYMKYYFTDAISKLDSALDDLSILRRR